MNAYAEIGKILGYIFGGGLLSATAVILAAKIADKKDRDLKRQEINSKREEKTLDGEVLLRAKIVDDRSVWEERILKQVKDLDDKIEKQNGIIERERNKRMELETALHKADMKHEELQRQVEILRDQNQTQATEIIGLRDENRKHRQDCEQEIQLLHDQLMTAKRQLENALNERDEYKARLQAFMLTHNIGALEHIEVMGDDTNKRVRKVEQVVEKQLDGGSE